MILFLDYSFPWKKNSFLFKTVLGKTIISKGNIPVRLSRTPESQTCPKIWTRSKSFLLVTYAIINTFLRTNILIPILPGNNPLMRQMYEVDVPADSLTSGILPSCPALWRYRTQVTLDHFSLTFQQEVLSTDNRRNKVLAEFLQQVTLPEKQRNRSGF